MLVHGHACVCVFILGLLEIGCKQSIYYIDILIYLENVFLKSTDALSFLKKFSVIIKKKNVIKLIRSCLTAYGFSVMVSEDFPILRLDTFTHLFLHVFIFNI